MSDSEGSENNGDLGCEDSGGTSSPAEARVQDSGSLRLRPPDSKDDRPEWVRNLLEYYEYVSEETRLTKEKDKSRSRTFYTLRCSLCKITTNTRKRKSDDSNSVESAMVTGSGVFTFGRHLQRCHPGKHKPDVYESKKKTGHYKRNLESTGNTETVTTSVIGKTASLTAAAVQKYSEESVRQKEFRKAVLDYITLDGVPINCVEREGLRMLIFKADPKLTLPSRTTISRMLDTKYLEIQKHLKLVLSNMAIGSAHLLLDIWSSRQNHSVIGIQVRFIKDWRMHQLVIGFKQFKGSHDANSIRRKLQNLLSDDYGLSMMDFATVTADNASAIMAAFKDLQTGGSFSNLSGISSTLTTSGEILLEESDATDATLSTTEPNVENNAEILKNLTIQEEDACDVETNLITDAEMEAVIDAVLNHWASNDLHSIRRNSCLAHLLQLAVKDALKHMHVSALIKKMNSIVTWFHKSDKQTAALREETKLALVKPCDTRWNSAYYCIQRFCRETKAATETDDNETVASCVNKILRNAKKSNKGVPAPFSDEEMGDLKGLLLILKPFAELTDLWQGDGVTSSVVILSLIDAINDLEDVKIDDSTETAAELKAFQSDLRTSIIQRFGTNRDAGEKVVDASGKERKIVTLDIFNDEYFIMSTVLDPRVKYGPFEDGYASRLQLRNGIPSKAEVLELIKKYFKLEAEKNSNDVEVLSQTRSTNEQGSELSSQTSLQSEATKDVRRKKSVFERVNQYQASKINSENTMEELERYLSTDTVTQNPLRFWGLNEERYPTLSKIASKYLSMPATTACVERLFSVAGSILRARRASMTVGTAEKLICYKEYLRKGLVSH